MCLGSYVSCECSGHLWAQVRQTYITVYIRVHAKSNTDIKLYKMINVTTVSTGTTHKHWSCNSLLWIVVSHSFLFFFFFFLCFQLTTTVSVDYCCCGDTFVSLPFLNFVLWSVFISLYIRPGIQLPQIHEITGSCMCSQSRGITSVSRISLLLSHAHTTGRYIYVSHESDTYLIYCYIYRNCYRRMSVWQPWYTGVLLKKKKKRWDENRFTWWPGRRSADCKLAWP